MTRSNASETAPEATQRQRASFEVQMKVARDIMRKRKSLLRQLARL